MGHNTSRKRPEHPALPYMACVAKPVLLRFVNDFAVHDVCALKNADPAEAFSWILRPDGTFLAFAHQPLTPAEHRAKLGTARRFAAMVVSSFGADECRFFMWDGYRLQRYACAADLDAAMAAHEDMLAERKRAGDLADRGVA